jgi:hypothetical protein
MHQQSSRILWQELYCVLKKYLIGKGILLSAICSIPLMRVQICKALIIDVDFSLPYQGI